MKRLVNKWPWLSQKKTYKKSLSEFGLIRRSLLKAVSSFQKHILQSWDNHELYYLMAHLHFYLWFGLRLSKEVKKGSSLAMRAARRHALLVAKYVSYSNIHLHSHIYAAKTMHLKSFLALSFIQRLKNKMNEKESA